ncbi:MAG TPA: GH3 auxin-responsive promoter family protein, partial [Planctomycetota bacterium]|nr:GH3 auxin-responsive promoter family protein [Planctomycetota bacterium]
MALHRVLRWLLFRKCLRRYRRFLRHARNPREVQRDVLLDKIRRCRDSRFGREHGFDDIRTVDDFRRRLPLSTWEDYLPWIEALKHGDVRACFGPGERVLMFALTSGTHAEPKSIPVTRTFLDEYRVGWHVWGGAVVRTCPAAYDERIFRIVSPHDETRTEAGIPCGAISGFMTESLPRIVRTHYVPPLDVARVGDAAAKYYLAGRIGVTRRISLLSSANPSTVLAVVRTVDEHRESIVRDVHDGTVDARWDVPVEITRRLVRHLRPNPRRARELE